MRYLFAGHTLDTDRRELRRGSDVLPVAPQVFDLLAYLISHRERAVSKDELISAIWNGRAVSDAALTTRLNVARCAIGDSGEQQHLIKTLPRKGFRFVGAVQEETQGQRGSTTPGGVIAETPSSAHRLSIVVLPFANLSGDPQQAYFVDGVTESLTTDLSRISGSFVIGRHTAFRYKDKAVELSKIGRELNIRHVLQGSVQRSGNRVRVNVQLVDAESGNHLWAERFDNPVADLFDMQDEIVSRLANSLDAQIVEIEARRAEHSIHPDLMDLYFQGIAHLNKGVTLEHLTRAHGFFERVLALDPGNVEALVGTAIVDCLLGVNFFTDDRAASLAAAETALNKALSLAPQHARGHMNLGAVYIFTSRAAQGISECERALALDRNLANAHGWIGRGKFHLGRAEETEAHIHEAIRLSPRDIYAYRWMMVMGLAKFWLGADAEAVAWLRRSIEANRNFPFTHFFLAAALALVGQLDEARAVAQAGLVLQPNFTIRRFRANPYSDNPCYLAQRERVYEGMRLAGVPDG
ncbi:MULTISPECIES: winged helix-turn-helix domain-containing protein [unclassified Bradyrhizobium]